MKYMVFSFGSIDPASKYIIPLFFEKVKWFFVKILKILCARNVGISTVLEVTQKFVA